ncbi:M48 family metallopeptidase [Methanofollis fontis]|nr:SprT family zinc-dependent metalloprotease [Methanofollis fontis]
MAHRSLPSRGPNEVIKKNGETIVQTTSGSAGPESGIIRIASQNKGQATLTVGNTEIPCRIVRRSGAVRLTLQILPDNSLRLTAPPGISKQVIESFVESKAAFIQEKIAARAPARGIEYRDGGAILLFGREVTVNAGGTGEITLRGDLLCVPEGRQVKAAVAAYLREITRSEVERHLPHYAAAFGVKVPPIEIRSYKTSWGKCRTDGRIFFNERCAMLPADLIEYVVAHEVCHIHHPHHQRSFHDALRAVMPDADERKRRMRHYHPLWVTGEGSGTATKKA